jgi:hypothetical protein
MKNWKENLKMSLNNHGYHPKDEWKKQLYAWCREWINEVNKLDGLCATVTSDYFIVSIEVIRNGFYTTSFLIKLNYFVDDKGVVFLNIQSVISFDFRGYLMNLPESDFNKLDYYKWDNDEISGDEIFHEGFVLQTITIAFQKYLTRFEQKS